MLAAGRIGMAARATTFESLSSEAIETLGYDCLEEDHGGWENNDGAYGEFTFDVAERTITLDYNERHMESDHSAHTF